MIDPVQDFLKNVQAYADAEWPAHRDRIRAALPGAAVPDKLIVPGLRPDNPQNKPFNKGEALLGAAVQKRGLQYQWGGIGNPSFDCSGLTQWAARNVGSAIGRTTYDQVHDGYSVPFKEVQIGDLLFSRFSNPTRPEHVSIWAGNGKVFEAGNPLDFYNWGDRGYFEVRRVV